MIFSNPAYRNNSSLSRINDSYLFVFARRRKQTAVEIPRYGEDGVRVYRNDTETLGSSRVPYYTLHTMETNDSLYRCSTEHKGLTR